MSANNSIDLVSLDFFTIENSLRNYLRDNSQFQDYDYEGSNIKLLIELLAVNASKTGFYQNMVLNESFLDSSVLKNSALSRAKELNYLPDSAKSAKARIKVVFEGTGDNAPYIIPKGSLLTSLVKNDSFTFSIPDIITVASANTTYSFETDIFEGYYVSDTYTFLSSKESFTQRFELTNKNADINSLTVTVFENGNEVGQIFTFAPSLLDLDGNSKVFFLQPSENGYYEVIFGNGIHGRKPKGNSTIVLNYRISSGSEANGAKVFSLDFDPTGVNELVGQVVVNTLQESRDGIEAETLDSIKFMAPRHFQTQERAVTSNDYKVMLKKKFPEINTLHTYGGEDLTPKRYGRVFVAIDIKNVTGIPDSKKAQYQAFLKNRTTFGIIPTFIEADFLYLRIDTKVRFNLNVTDASRETIKTLVFDKIIAFNNKYLDDFNVILRQSKLDSDISDADNSIISSSTNIKAYKKINPTLGKLQNWNLQFGAEFRTDIPEKQKIHDKNEISAVTSSRFIYNTEPAIIEDDGAGILRVMRVSGEQYKRILDIGTVDYKNGIINISDLKVDQYFGNSIKFFVLMKDKDIAASLNNILTIEEDEIHITPEEIRI